MAVERYASPSHIREIAGNCIRLEVESMQREWLGAAHGCSMLAELAGHVSAWGS